MSVALQNFPPLGNQYGARKAILLCKLVGPGLHRGYGRRLGHAGRGKLRRKRHTRDLQTLNCGRVCGTERKIEQECLLNVLPLQKSGQAQLAAFFNAEYIKASELIVPPYDVLRRSLVVIAIIEGLDLGKITGIRSGQPGREDLSGRSARNRCP